MISQRLRGVKEDGEAMEDGFMPKLKKAFGDAGVEIEDQNGELRSTYDILNDLAGVWDTLGSKQKQYLGEKAAGNRQVKVLNAIMANWDVVQDTIEKANDSAGAAEEGNEKYMDSIEGRITKLQSSFQDLARTTIDGGFAKGLVDMGTGLVDFTTNIGGVIPVLQSLFGVLFMFKGGSMISGIGKFFGSLSGVFSAGGLSALTGSIGLLITLSTVLGRVGESLKTSNQLKANKESYQLSLDNIDSAKGKLANVEAQINELQSKGTLTFVEQEELNKLQQVSAELKSQIETEQILANAKKGIVEKTAAELAQNYYDQSEGNLISDLGNAAKLIGGEAVKWGSEKLTTAWLKMWGFNDKDIQQQIGNNAEMLGYDNWGASNKERFEKGIAQFYDGISKGVEEESKLYDSILTNYSNGKHYNKNADRFADNRSRINSDMESAANGLVEAQKIYQEYASALDGLEKNKTTEPLFNLVEDMGRQIQDASQEYVDRYGNQTNFIDSLLGIAGKETLESNKFSVVTKDLIELAKAGKLTASALADEKYSSFTDVLDAVGISAQEAAGYLSSLYNTEVDGFNVESGEFKFELPEPDMSTTVTGLYTATDGYKNLTAAMQEYQKSGTVSAQTWSQLIQESGKAAEMLDLSANGFRLNVDAYYDFLAAQQRGSRNEAVLGLADAQKRLEELQKQRDAILSMGGMSTAKIDLQIEGTQQEVDQWTAIIREIDSATNAVARYNAAKGTKNEDDDFNTVQGAVEDITEGRKSGKVGTDDYRSALDLVLGKDWRTRTKEDGTLLYNDIDEAGKAAEKLGERYFGKDEGKNLDNFYNDVVKNGFGEFNDQGTVTFFTNIGNAADGAAVTVQSLADSLGTSSEAVQSLLGLTNTYLDLGEKIELPEILTQEDVDQAIQSASYEEAVNQVDALNGKIEEYKQNLEELNKNPEENATQIEDIQNQLKLMEQLRDAYQEIVENGPPEGFEDSSLAGVFDTVKQTADAINEIRDNGVEIPITLTGDYDILLALLDAMGVDTTELRVAIHAKEENPLRPSEDTSNTGQPNTLSDATRDHYQNKVLGEDNQVEVEADEVNVESNATETKTDKKDTWDMPTVEDEINKDSLEQYLDKPISEVPEQLRSAVMELAMEQVQKEVQKEADTTKDKNTPLNETTKEAYGRKTDKLIGTENDSTQPLKEENELRPITENGETQIETDSVNIDTSNVEEKDNGTEVSEGPSQEMQDWANGLTQEPGWVDNSGDVMPNQEPSQEGETQIEADNAEVNIDKAEEGDNSNANILDLLFGGGGPAHGEEDTYTNQTYNDVGAGSDKEWTFHNGDTEETVEVKGEITEVDTTAIEEQVESNPPVITPEIDENTPFYSAEEIFGGDGTVTVTPEVETPDTTNVEAAIDSVKGEVQVEAQTNGVQEQVESAIPESEEVQINVITPGFKDLDTPESTESTVSLNLDSSEVDSYEPEEKDATVTFGVESSEPDSYQPEDKTATATYDLNAPPPPEYPNQNPSVNYSMNAPAPPNYQDINRTVTYTYKTVGTPPSGAGGAANAKGTKNAVGGQSLVDEKGAELIEHTRQGTFELGTNKGPRLTHLEPGDVVHTASETRSILSRMASIGGFFRDGLNQTKAIIGNAFATGIQGGYGRKRWGGGSGYSTSTPKKKKTYNYDRDDSDDSNRSSSRTTSRQSYSEPTYTSTRRRHSHHSSPERFIKEGSSGLSKGSGGKSSKEKDPFTEWTESLFDWAEIRLSRLKDITEEWLSKVVNVVKYVNQNKYLENAIKSVTKEITASQDAYKLYMAQAAKVAQKGGLSADIIKKIQNGTIEIGEYDEDTRKRIEEYQKWYEKAKKLKKTITDLKKQQRELAKQKLDNIATYYDNRINKLADLKSRRDATIELRREQGRQITPSMYNTSKKAVSEEIKLYNKEAKRLQKELDSAVSKGRIKRGSDDWYKYRHMIDQAKQSVIELSTELIKLKDEQKKFKSIKIGYKIDAKKADLDKLEQIDDRLRARRSINYNRTTDQAMIDNIKSQISLINQQNKEYQKQQKGLDKYSEKWQELQKIINDNENEMGNLKKTLRELQDAIDRVDVEKLIWRFENLEYAAEGMKDFMDLHEAQNIEETAEAYKKLIDNGMQQIENLERQNEEYVKLQGELPKTSEVYRELQKQIEDNNRAIMDMKVSQEEYNDAVIDLKITQLENYKDTLERVNDQYERQKELREAIEELEKVQSQRSVRVFKEGIGFVYEANQDDLKSAQENLEDILQNQLLDSIDDLVNALEDVKKDSNIYDANGNLLGREYVIPQIGTLNNLLTDYYKNLNAAVPLSELKDSIGSISNVSTSGNMNFEFGDINLSDVNDVETLAKAIINQLPNALVQAIHKTL